MIQYEWSCLDGNGGFSEQFCCGAFAQTNLRGGDTMNIVTVLTIIASCITIYEFFYSIYRHFTSRK